MKFLQQSTWRYLNEFVFKKDVADITLVGNSYQLIRKSSKGCSWSQILGVEKKDTLVGVRTEQVRALPHGLTHFATQLGFCDTVASFLPKTDSPSLDSKKHLQDEFFEHAWKKPWRKNMPEATVIVPTGSWETIRSSLGSNTKSQCKKALNDGFTFARASEEERVDFYAIWKEVSTHKGFSIWDYDIYTKLCTYLLSTGKGDLCIVKNEKGIGAGSIVIYDETPRYLYGAANRKWGNRGTHYLLMVKILEYLHDRGDLSFDLFGVSGYGIQDELSGVTSFKYSFGGEHVEVLGNFDRVYQPFLYQGVKFFSKRK